ncbi:15064_t:CDS:2 [Cetraspora pellucida]|uniref:15064_t:CDS:1 n=1 Tax=Cetraspora pellucida TaxID=1433469 RepID=A0A9N9HJD7_9GLOM|nr:15064_t:CDS:2 [Cetraspora pellucida]
MDKNKFYMIPLELMIIIFKYLNFKQQIKLHLISKQFYYTFDFIYQENIRYTYFSNPKIENIDPEIHVMCYNFRIKDFEDNIFIKEILKIKNDWIYFTNNTRRKLKRNDDNSIYCHERNYQNKDYDPNFFLINSIITLTPYNKKYIKDINKRICDNCKEFKIANRIIKKNNKCKTDMCIFNVPKKTLEITNKDVGTNIVSCEGIYNFETFLIYGIYQYQGDVPLYKIDKIINNLDKNIKLERIFIFSNQNIPYDNKSVNICEYKDFFEVFKTKVSWKLLMMNEDMVEKSNIDESEKEVDEIISEQIIESGINDKNGFDKYKKFNFRRLERKIIIDSSDDKLVKKRKKNYDSDFIPEKQNKRKRKRANELNDLLQNSQDFLNWPIKKNKNELVEDKEPIKCQINKNDEFQILNKNLQNVLPKELSINELEIIKKPNNRKKVGRKLANNDDKLAQENKKAYNNQHKDFSEKIVKEYNTLKENYENMKKEYYSLKEDHENIKKEYNLLKQSHETIEKEVGILKLINSDKECRIEIMEDVEENSTTDVQNINNQNKISSIEVNDGNIDLDAHIGSYFNMFNKGEKYFSLNETFNLRQHRAKSYENDFEVWFYNVNLYCEKFGIKYFWSLIDLENYYKNNLAHQYY